MKRERRDYFKKYFSISENKIKTALAKKKYSVQNRKKIIDSKRNWRHSHKKEYAEQGRKRVLREKNVGGSHTLAEWETLKAQYNWTCPCCHRPEPIIKLTHDHIIPITKGGSDNIENI